MLGYSAHVRHFVLNLYFIVASNTPVLHIIPPTKWATVTKNTTEGEPEINFGEKEVITTTEGAREMIAVGRGVKIGLTGDAIKDLGIRTGEGETTESSKEAGGIVLGDIMN